MDQHLDFSHSISFGGIILELKDMSVVWIAYWLMDLLLDNSDQKNF